MQKKSNCNSGITLIALIITIIVMLILVAVTVNTAVNSGLFGHAKNATQGWKAEEEKEMNLGNDNYIKDTVNKYTSKVDKSYLKVGDYVAYTPDTAENYMGLGTSENEKSGSSQNPVDGISQDTTLKWRIMNINDDGSVDIISDKPTSEKVYFNNSIGFNNGIYLLNDLCASLYSNSTLEVTARSMNLMDIESKFNSTGIAARDAYVNTDSNIQYGSSKNYSTTNANVPDIYKHVGKTLSEETKPYYTEPTKLTHTTETSLDVQQTYYKFDSTPASYFDDAIFHELVFNTGTYYWLASRYASCNANNAGFGLRDVNGTAIRSASLFLSNGVANNGVGHFVRPVVTFRSDIQISQTGGTADNPREISK